MKNNRNVNMEDTSRLNIVRYALPIVATSYLHQLFNSADSAVVGRFVGPQALAAVGGNASVIALLIGLFNGLSVGANVVVARYLGEDNKSKVETAVPSVFLLGLFCGLAVALLGITVARPMLTLISTPSDVIDLATLYLRIYFAGMPFIMVFNFGSAILRSNGETKKPLIALAVSGVINIILNLVFVIALDMSVAGVGLATVISNMASAFYIVRCLVNRNDVLKLKFSNFQFNRDAVLSSLKIGLPAGLQGIVFSISNVTILSAINSFGSKAAAGSTITLVYEQFSYYITEAFSQAAVSFVSHNYGARDLQNCRQAYKNSFILSSVCEFLFDCIVLILRYPLIKLFTSDAQVIDFAVKRFYIVVGMHFLISTYEISGACLRGYGKSMIPAVISVVCSCGIRLFWVFFILPLNRTFTFLFMAYPVSWILCGIAISTAYNKEFSKKLKQVQNTVKVLPQ